MTLSEGAFHHLGPVPSATLRAMATAATRAGDLLRQAARNRSALEVSEKSAGDFVSDADRQAEAEISRTLSAAFPDYNWLGEESGTRTNPKQNLTWIVDPLDGTTNFLKGIPHWAISIALCRDEEILAGLVYDPVKEEMFSAEQGKGAFLNGAPMQVSQTDNFQAALFATGVPAGGRVTYLRHCLRDLERLMPLCAGIRRGGAAALDLAYVAAGRYEGYWERNLGAWDVAAGLLLVTEAGGHVVPLWPDHSILSSGSFVASSMTLAAELTENLDRTQIA